jgi:hypothetical protein
MNVTIREHVIDGGSCWCGPTVEFIGDGHIVIHNEIEATK